MNFKDKFKARSEGNKTKDNWETVQRDDITISNITRSGALQEGYPSSSAENNGTVQTIDGVRETTGAVSDNYLSTHAENVETAPIDDIIYKGTSGSLPESHHSSCAANGVRGTTGALPENYPSLVEKYTSCRWRLGYLMVVAFILVQSMLNSMSFALVCMTTAPTGTDNHSLSGANGSALSQNMTTVYGYSNSMPPAAEFDYSSETQGILISSVYYPGIISPLFGSFASRAVGPKKVILASMSCGALMMMLIPTAARSAVYLVVLCRVLLGFSVSIVAAVSFDLWIYWAPEREKAQLVAYSFNGFNIASIVTFSVSGLLCLIPLDNGWPFIFYLFGGLTLIWCCLCQWMVYERPEVHPTISEKEKAFILLNRSKQDKDSKKKRIPWTNMLKTRGVWAFFIISFSHNFNAALMFSYIPLYMATELKFNIEETGFLSSLPYVIRVISIPFTSYICVRLLGCLSVTNIRKLIQCGGFLVAAVLVSLLSIFKEGQSFEAVAVLSSSTPFQAVSVNAATIVPLDMAPQYAAILSSVGAALSHVGNMISPLMASQILTERSHEQWNMVFFMMAGVFVLSALLFLFLASGELQPWAYDVEMNIEKRESRNMKIDSYVNESYIADRDETTHM